MLSVLSRYQSFAPRLPEGIRGVLSAPASGALAKLAAPFARKSDAAAFPMDALVIEADAEAMIPLDKLAMHTRRLAQNGDWEKLGALITSFDRRRATFGGRRLARLAAEGAGTLPLLDLTRAISEAPCDVHLAAITALGHIRAAQISREAMGGERKRYEAWVRYYHHVEQATDLMEGVDAVSMESPLLAAIQHLIATHHDYAPEQIDHSFAVAMALDPLDWDVMGAHALALSQSGSRAMDRIEVAARETMDATQDLAGAAAYAAFYLGLIDSDLAVLSELDIALFETGLRDMAILSEDDPIEINRNAARCSLSAHVALRPAAIRFIRNHLRSVVPAQWPVDEMEVRHQIALAYAPELRAGQSVRIAPSGVHVAAARAA